MVTPHTIVFPEDTGQTLTTKLVKRDDDSIVYTASTVTERTNGKGIYDAAFADLPAGDYTLHNFVSSVLSSVGLVMSVADGNVIVYEQSLVQGGGSGGSVVLSTEVTRAASSLSPGLIEFKRGDTVRKELTGLGDITDRQKLWFTLKNNANDQDADAILQITEADGCTVFNGAAPTSASLASIVITDAVTGVATLYIDKSLSRSVGNLTGQNTQNRALTAAPWDVQVERNNSTADTNTVGEGVCNVNLDITRAIS